MSRKNPKKNYFKIEFKNCGLDYDWTIADDWSNLVEILDSVRSSFEDEDDIEAEDRPEITFYPIDMTDEEYGDLVEKWEDFNA